MADERADVTQREACAASSLRNYRGISFNSEAASQAPLFDEKRGDAEFIRRKNPRTANEPERHAGTQNDYS